MDRQTRPDVYTVIKNPMSYVLPYEVWISGDVLHWTGIETVRRRITRKVKSFRKEQKAKDAIEYWQNIAKFKKDAE